MAELVAYRVGLLGDEQSQARAHSPTAAPNAGAFSSDGPNGASSASVPVGWVRGPCGQSGPQSGLRGRPVRRRSVGPAPASGVVCAGVEDAVRIPETILGRVVDVWSAPDESRLDGTGVRGG